MQLKYHVVTIEDLVPENHVLRKVEAALDLSFIHEETAHLYSQKYGRPAIDPVVLVKYLLLGYLYGIPSERQIEERCRDSNAFRWYLGIDLNERVPDHSTISQLRRRKPKHPHRRVSRTDPDAGWLMVFCARRCARIVLEAGKKIQFVRPKRVLLGPRIEAQHEKLIRDASGYYEIPVVKMLCTEYGLQEISETQGGKANPLPQR